MVGAVFAHRLVFRGYVLLDRSASEGRTCEDIVLFGCGHIMHETCLNKVLAETESKKIFLRLDQKGCPICSEDKFINPYITQMVI